MPSPRTHSEIRWVGLSLESVTKKETRLMGNGLCDHRVETSQGIMSFEFGAFNFISYRIV